MYTVSIGLTTKAGTQAVKHDLVVASSDHPASSKPLTVR
jgi:hypothetical protein